MLALPSHRWFWVTPLNSLRSSFKMSRVKPTSWGCRDIVPVTALYRMRSGSLSYRQTHRGTQLQLGDCRPDTMVAQGASWGELTTGWKEKGGTSEVSVGPAGHREGSPSPSKMWAKKGCSTDCARAVGETANRYSRCGEQFEVPPKIKNRTTT